MFKLMKPERRMKGRENINAFTVSGPHGVSGTNDSSRP